MCRGVPCGGRCFISRFGSRRGLSFHVLDGLAVAVGVDHDDDVGARSEGRVVKVGYSADVGLDICPYAVEGVNVENPALARGLDLLNAGSGPDGEFGG